MKYRSFALLLASPFFALNALADTCVSVRTDVLDALGLKTGAPPVNVKETKKVGAEVESVRNAWTTIESNLNAIETAKESESDKKADRKGQEVKILRDFTWVASKGLLPANADSFTVTQIPIVDGPWQGLKPARMAVTTAGKSDELLSIRVASASMVDPRGYINTDRVTTSLDFEHVGAECRVKNFAIDSWDMDLPTVDEFKMNVTAETCQGALGKKPLTDKATRPQIAAAAKALFVGDDAYRASFGYAETRSDEISELVKNFNSELSFRTTVCKRFGKYVGGPDFSNPVGTTGGTPAGGKPTTVKPAATGAKKTKTVN